MELLLPLALIVLIGMFLSSIFQPRSQPPQIIYVQAEQPDTYGGGMGCAPILLIGAVAILLLALLPAG